MPGYTFQDPDTGQTVSFQADTPPTEKEIQAIFDHVNHVSSLSAQPERGTLSKVGEFLRDNPVTEAVLGPSERKRLAEGVPNPETGRLEIKPAGNKIEQQGLVPAVKTSLSTPIAPIPTLAENPNAGIGESLARAAANTGIGVANAMQSPIGVASIPFPPVRTAFAADMLANAPGEAVETYQAAKEGNKQAALEHAAQVALAGLAGAHEFLPAKETGISPAREALNEAGETIAGGKQPPFDPKQAAAQMVENERLRQADEAARQALKPENAQVKMQPGQREADVELKRAELDRNVNRINARNIATRLDTGDTWTPIDQMIAEAKYGVGPETRTIEAEGGKLGFRREPVETAPNVTDETAEAYRREQAADAEKARAEEPEPDPLREHQDRVRDIYEAGEALRKADPCL